MFKVAVFNIKDLIKYSVLLIIIIVTILGLTKFFNKLKKLDIEVYAKNEEIEQDPGYEGFFNYDFTGCIETTSPIVGSISNNKDEAKEKIGKNLYEEILKSQIGSIQVYSSKNNTEETKVANLENEENEENEDNKENIENEKQEEKNQIELAKTGLNTEIVTENPLSLNYNVEYGSVKIKNGTSFELSDDIMNPNISIDNKSILLFHTHTCESYTSSEKFPYEPTGNYRTTDLNFTVARVGDELENHLKQYGYNVIHNKDYHDYPSYNGSYTNSLATVEGVLKDNPTDVIFDIHRDAIGSRSDYAPCVKIGDDVCAQIMFVIGTNEGGLWHPNWQQNLKFAIKVQQKAEELYPGLFKPIMLTKYRYNQHTGKFASIIEVGATGNTLEQCNYSMKYFAKVLDEVFK